MPQLTPDQIAAVTASRAHVEAIASIDRMRAEIAKAIVGAEAGDALGVAVHVRRARAQWGAAMDRQSQSERIREALRAL